jgi:creatinine amidohydrolase/Fe(II)-dependent formamide hydrolase-like protein
MNSSVLCLLLLSSHYTTLAFLKRHSGNFYGVERIVCVVAHGGGVAVVVQCVFRCWNDRCSVVVVIILSTLWCFMHMHKVRVKLYVVACLQDNVFFQSKLSR